MAVNESNLRKIRAILQQDQLSRSDVDQLVRLGGLGGTLPDEDGKTAAGEPFWNRASFQAWATKDALHYRDTVRPAHSTESGLHHR